MRSPWRWFGLCLLLGLVLSAPARAQEEQLLDDVLRAANTAVAKMAGDLVNARRVEPLTGKGLLIAPFLLNMPDVGNEEMQALIDTWVQEKVLTAVIAADDETGHFEVTDREPLRAIMQGLKLPADALAHAEHWPTVAAATGAEYLVTGSVSMMPMEAEHGLSVALSFTARIVALKDGKIIAAATQDVTCTTPPPPPAAAPVQ